jgi:hypothetical protein
MIDKFHLLIGGNDDSLALVANHMFNKNIIITNDNFNEIDRTLFDVCYTSLADLNLTDLTKLVQEAGEIHYYPPTDPTLQKYTEKFLKKIIKTYGVTVRNFSRPTDDSTLFLCETRKSENPQLWLAGCSFSYGFGLRNSNDRYIEIISAEMGLPYSDLSFPGSSIDFAADQILRSDIKKNDIIIWGLTGANRISYYIDDRYCSILETKLHLFNSTDQLFFSRLITDDNVANWAIKNIFQVLNYVEKIGATIIILAHTDLSLSVHTDKIENFLYDKKCWVNPTPIFDYTDDNHPGPKTNASWAKQVLNLIHGIKVDN